MNNTTNSWEGRVEQLIDDTEFSTPKKVKMIIMDFIRILLHDTEIAAREEIKSPARQSGADD